MPPSTHSPITLRAVCIGLIGSLILNLGMLYSDFYLNNTLLVGNHFPVASLGLVMILVLGVNPIIRGFFKGEGLSSAELLLIWGMIGVAGGIGAAGFMRYMPGFLASPAYLANASNGIDEYVLKHLPDWMILSRDPQDPAVRAFFEGLPVGGKLPWGRWLLPLGAWFLLGVAIFAAFYALTSLFFHAWVSRERLTFALVHLPLDLAREPEPGRLYNAFLRNPWTWAGLTIPVVHNLVNGIHKYVPSVPVIPFFWSGKWFTERPWSEFDLGGMGLYYSVVGLSFLLTTEMSLSIWSFYVVFRLSFVFIAWIGAVAGADAAGFWGDWDNQVGNYETGGAVLALAIFLVWGARKPLGEWLGRVAKGTRDQEADPLNPRFTLFLMAAGFCGMAAWLKLAGLGPWASLFTVTVFLAVSLVLTRVVAESGMLNVATGAAAYSLLTGLFPAAALPAATVAVLCVVHGALMADMQCVAMPYLVNGLKAARETRMPAGKVLLAFALAAAVGWFAGAFGRITTNYKFGAANLDKLGSMWVAQYTLPGAVSFQKNPPAPNPVKLGSVKLLPAKAMHFVIGALIAAAMLWLRSRYLWWPLHPLGLVICTQIVFKWIWFSIFLGWLCKTCVMSFGGAGLYRKILPFFLGLVLGEYLIALFWIAVAFATNESAYNLLMHW